MNRYLFALSIGLLAISGCGSGGSAGSAGNSGISDNSDSAPSNNFSTAASLEDASTRDLSCPSPRVEKGGRISAPNQSYFEIFRLTEPTEITLYTANAEFDTFCTLKDEQDTILASDDAGGVGDNCSISAPSLPSGSYSIEVRAYDNLATGEFYLGSRCSSTSDPSTPPSDPSTPPSGPSTPPSGPSTPPSGPSTPPSGPSTPPSDPSTPAEEVGDISFTLEWTHSGSSRAEGPDIDIWVENPSGERLSSSTDGLQLGPDSFGGSISADDRGGWGDGDGNGPERAFWPENEAPEGTYRVGVRYFDGDGEATVLVRVFHGSTPINTWFVRLSAQGAAAQVATHSYP